MADIMVTTPRPRLPPKVAPTLASQIPPDSVEAVIDAVDNPTAPTICSVIINDSLPAQAGFVWNQSFAQKFAVAPTVPAEPPSGTLYYNNPTTREGGSIVYVNIASRTVISVTRNVSTVAAQDYSQLFQYIKHTGAYDSTHSFQNPAPIDKTQLATNPNPSQAPLFSRSPVNNELNGVFDYIVGVGNTSSASATGTYDAETNFTLTIANPPWLAATRQYRVVAGATFNFSAENGDIPPNATGTYSVIWTGQGAGIAYDCYIAYIDQAGNPSAPAFVGTTAANGLSIARTNQAPLSPTTPPVVLNPVKGNAIVGASGASATFDQPVTWTGDVNQTLSNTTVAEIQLMATQTGTSNWFKAGDIPPVAAATSPSITAIWPTLGASNSYDLAIRLLGFDGKYGQQSAIIATTNLNPQLLGPNNLQTMPTATQTSGPEIVQDVVIGIQNAGNYTVNVQLEALIQDWPANDAPPWFAGTKFYWRQHNASVLVSGPGSGTFCGENGPQGSNQGTGPGEQVSFYCLALGVPAGVNVDYGMSYKDIAGNESNISWPAGGWMGINPPAPITTGPSAPQGLSNVNYISDSNMDYIAASYPGSSYWTYAGIDSTRFKVNQPGSSSTALPGGTSKNYLAADAHGGHAVGPVAAYPEVIQVATGVTYTVSCLGNLNDAHGGVAFIAIVSVADKTANNGTPLTIYAKAALANEGNPGTVTQVAWTSTVTGPVAVCCYANGITGSAAWSQPQFEVGSVASSYKVGAAVTKENTITYDAQSGEVTSTIQRNTGGIDLSNPNHSNVNLDYIASTSTYSKTSQSPPLGNNMIDNYNLSVLGDTTNADQTYEYLFHNWSNAGYPAEYVSMTASPEPAGSSYGTYCLSIDVLPNITLPPKTLVQGAVFTRPVPVIAGEGIVVSCAASLNYNLSLPPGVSGYATMYVRFYDNTGALLSAVSSTNLGFPGNTGAPQVFTSAQIIVPPGSFTASVLFVSGVNNQAATVAAVGNGAVWNFALCAVSMRPILNVGTDVNGNLPHGNQSISTLSVVNSNGTFNAGQATGNVPYAANSPAVTSVVLTNGTYNAAVAAGTLPYGNGPVAVLNVIQGNGTFNAATAGAGNLPVINATINEGAAIGTNGAILGIAATVGITGQTNNTNTTNASITLPALGTWSITCSWSLSGTNWETLILQPPGSTNFQTSVDSAEGTQSSLQCQAFCRAAGGSTVTFGLRGVANGTTPSLQYAGTVNIVAYRLS